jgi:hypothetical protein
MQKYYMLCQYGYVICGVGKTERGALLDARKGGMPADWENDVKDSIHQCNHGDMVYLQMDEEFFNGIKYGDIQPDCSFVIDRYGVAHLPKKFTESDIGVWIDCGKYTPSEIDKIIIDCAAAYGFNPEPYDQADDEILHEVSEEAEDFLNDLLLPEGYSFQDIPEQGVWGILKDEED